MDNLQKQFDTRIRAVEAIDENLGTIRLDITKLFNEQSRHKSENSRLIKKMETITQMSSQAQSVVDDKVAELEKTILKWDTHPRNNDQLLKIQNLENDVSKMETSVVSLSQKNQILENNLNQRFRDVNQQARFESDMNYWVVFSEIVFELLKSWLIFIRIWKKLEKILLRIDLGNMHFQDHWFRNYFFYQNYFWHKMILKSNMKSIQKLEMQFNVSVKLEEISLVLLKHFQKLKIELVIWKSRFGKWGLSFD